MGEGGARGLEMMTFYSTMYFVFVTQEEGVVKPYESFDPKKDCEILRKAMKGNFLYSFL